MWEGERRFATRGAGPPPFLSEVEQVPPKSASRAIVSDGVGGTACAAHRDGIEIFAFECEQGRREAAAGTTSMWAQRGWRG